MNFGKALEIIRGGGAVYRSDWKKKGNYIYLEDALGYLEDALRYPVKTGAFSGPLRRYAPCFVMFTEQKVHQPGWLPNQSDMLSDDWEIVPRDKIINQPDAQVT